jgi:hypothetical protein
MTTPDRPTLDYAGPQGRDPESKTIGEKLILGVIIALAAFMLLPLFGALVLWFLFRKP